MTTIGKFIEQAPPSMSKVTADGSGANPAIAPETPQEEGWWKAASPWVHGVLGVASFVPGLSIITGGADAAIYAAEGNALEAGIAAASMIPGGKIVTTLGEVAKSAIGAGKVSRIAKGSHEAEEMAKAAKALKEANEAAAAKLAKEAAEAEKLKKARNLDNAQNNRPPEPNQGKTKDNVNVKGKEHKVPCFHPFDKKKFMQMSKGDQKDYLKEMAKQLRQQEAEINKMTAAEYMNARKLFNDAKKLNPKSGGRNPLADAMQEEFRADKSLEIRDSIKRSLQKSGMAAPQAKAQARQLTEKIMDKLAALHEPDMVAGGWNNPSTESIGRKDVNSSIGGSWNQSGRIDSMDNSAKEAIAQGKGDQKMNVKLEPCRGKQ